MSEPGSAPKKPEEALVSGAEPTLAASSEQAPNEPPAAQAAPSDAHELNLDASTRPAREGTDWTNREVAGRYKVLERLGEGGMGVVYVAEHLSLKKRVAFKVIHPELAAHGDLLLRFRREALATGQLDHPHIAAAIDFGELDGGGAFIVMPLVRGHSLQHELDQQGKLEFRRAAQICSQIADALSAAHSMGIVHRDLKPDNVLLEKRSDGSEAAKVLDFGVASLAGRSEGLSMHARPLTQAGTILGTPGYMSPEQASAGEVDHRTDIYALGVILWELCRGERLFSGPDITQIFAKQFKSVPTALELGLSAPARELSALVTRMLAWDKSARPDSAAEVRDTLRRIAAMPDSLRIPVSLFPAALQRLPLPERLTPYRGWVLLGFAALLVLAAMVYWRAGRRPPPLPGDAPAVAAREPSAVQRERVATAEEPAIEPEPEEEPEEPVAAEPRPSRGESRDLQEVLENLLNARSTNSRRTAAKWIQRREGGVPRYAKLLAELELNGRCNDKKEVVERMRQLGDRRVLPALERLANAPRRGCGLLRLTDCYACLRRDLDQTIGSLRN
jgi:tRNA A-37 threonylcarbamoyl transferase component Bud32